MPRRNRNAGYTPLTEPIGERAREAFARLQRQHAQNCARIRSVHAPAS